MALLLQLKLHLPKRYAFSLILYFVVAFFLKIVCYIENACMYHLVFDFFSNLGRSIARLLIYIKICESYMEFVVNT